MKAVTRLFVSALMLVSCLALLVQAQDSQPAVISGSLRPTVLVRPTSQPAAAESGPSTVAALTRQRFQEAINRGELLIPLGVSEIDGPLYAAQRCRVRGEGPRSVLRLAAGGGGVAVASKPGELLVQFYLENFTIDGGGIYFDGYGQHSTIEKVKVYASPGNGIELRNGEGIKIRDCIAYGNQGDGLCIAPSGSSNHVLIDGLESTLNQGAGVRIEVKNGECVTPMLLNSIVQANGLGLGEAEVIIGGLVSQAMISNVWLEKSQRSSDIQKKPALIVRGVRGGDGVIRYPRGLSIVGNCVFNETLGPGIVITGSGTQIDGLRMDGPIRKIRVTIPSTNVPADFIPRGLFFDRSEKSVMEIW